MAIQRCPYCKAIIDEGAEYCTNCGTKLLFPEDEFIEEEIPGEKIFDVDEEVNGTQKEFSEQWQADSEEIEFIEEVKHETGSEDYFSETADNLERGEKRDTASELDESEADEPENEGDEREASTEEPVDEAPAETKLPKKRRSSRKKSRRKKAEKAEPVSEQADEIQEAEQADESVEMAAEDHMEDEILVEAEDTSKYEPFNEESIRGLTDDLPDGFAEKMDEAAGKVGEPLEEFEPDQSKEEKSVYTEISEQDLTPQPGTAEEKEWQTPPPDDEDLKEPEDLGDNIIQTGDLEEIVDEAEKEKVEIDEFVASIKKERESVRESLMPDTQDMPPWADSVQNGPLPDIPPTDEILLQEDASEDLEPSTEDSRSFEEAQKTGVSEEPFLASGEDEFRLSPGFDTGSAFPETVDQQGLPFVGKTEEDYVAEQAEQEPRVVEPESKKQVQPMGFGDWIKARIFDVGFVTALWFVALWIASQVLGNSVFRLISGSAPVTLIFLAVLLFIYFFFFLFFLGETLGNYLFSSDE